MITTVISIKPRRRAKPKQKKEELADIFGEEELIKEPSFSRPARPAGGATEDKEEKNVSAETPPRAKEEEKKKSKKPKKIDLKKLGDKIDELLKI